MTPTGIGSRWPPPSSTGESARVASPTKAGPDLSGRRVGGFELISPLATGGFATVYRARQVRLDREVAVKVLDPTLARDPDIAARFEREGRAAASLDHPNVVTVYEAGEDDGLVYLAMRWPTWVSPWVTLLILVREFAVQGFRSVAPCKGVLLRTSFASKSKTVFQYLCIGCALAGMAWQGGGVLGAMWGPLARVNLGAALVMAYFTMVRMFWRNRGILRKESLPLEQRDA